MNNDPAEPPSGAPGNARRLPIAWIGWLAGVACVAACSSRGTVDTEPPPEAAGQIHIAVGPQTYSLAIGEARCERAEAGGTPFLNVVAPAVGAPAIDQAGRPVDLLTARLPPALSAAPRSFGPDDPDYGAIASLPVRSMSAVDISAEDTPLVQVLARQIRGGAPSYRCQTHRSDQTISLACRRAKVFPWPLAGTVPTGAFRATVACKSSPVTPAP